MAADNLSIDITKSINISIRSKNNESLKDVDNAVYAINWFDTKSAWLYKLYNMLAVGSVLKIGGKPFLKAKSINLVQGENSLNRNVLLIVRYPNPASFLKLLSGKYFQLISLLRNAAVKDFTFGFATKTSSTKWEKKNDDLSYILHHYQADEFNQNQLLDVIKESGLSDSVKVLFSGNVDKNLFITKQAKEPAKLPCIIDGLVLFQTQDKEQLVQTLLGNKYQSIIDSNLKVSSLVELSRVL